MKASAVAAAVVVAAVAMATLAAACAEVDRPTCYAGDYIACGCGPAGGPRGFAACGADGEYAACVCDGRVPGLDAGKRAFMSACTTNDECETSLCQSYGTRGSFCSRPCTEATTAADCPAPSTGCNNNGICRAP